MTSLGRVRSVPTPLERNLEPYNQTHDALLYAAALSDVDVSPAVQGVRYVGYGETKYGYGPCCILDLAGTAYLAEPHVTWFPWTTPRQRIGHFKWYLEQVGKNSEVMLTVQKNQINFFEHFVKRNLLRKIGHIENLPIVEEVHMYQYKRSSM